MCKATLPILGGQVLSGLELFDVVAFNEAGERSLVVSAGVMLSGAIACARGFNSRPSHLVAVVLPASSNENSGRDSDEASPAAVLCDRVAQ